MGKLETAIASLRSKAVWADEPSASMMKQAADEIDKLRVALIRIRRTSNTNRNAGWRLAEMVRIATEALDG